MLKILLSMMALMVPLGCAIPFFPAQDKVGTALVPLELRPKTWNLIDFEVNKSSNMKMAHIFGDAFPNEAAACLYGRIDWKAEKGNRVGTLKVTGVREAILDSATTMAVYWPKGMRHGCEDASDLVGFAHSHPFRKCTYIGQPSHIDVVQLARDPRLLFTYVWCFDGYGVLIFQDGRRFAAPYISTGDST